MFPAVELKSRIILKVEATEECVEILQTQARLHLAAFVERERLKPLVILIPPALISTGGAPPLGISAMRRRRFQDSKAAYFLRLLKLVGFLHFVLPRAATSPSVMDLLSQKRGCHFSRDCLLDGILAHSYGR
jgi:hypothetical protein